MLQTLLYHSFSVRNARADGLDVYSDVVVIDVLFYDGRNRSKCLDTEMLASNRCEITEKTSAKSEDDVNDVGYSKQH